MSEGEKLAIKIMVILSIAVALFFIGLKYCCEYAGN